MFDLKYWKKKWIFVRMENEDINDSLKINKILMEK